MEEEEIYSGGVHSKGESQEILYVLCDMADTRVLSFLLFGYAKKWNKNSVHVRNKGLPVGKS